MGLVLLFVLQGSPKGSGSRDRFVLFILYVCLVLFDWILSVVGIHYLITTFSGSSSCAFLVELWEQERENERRRGLTYIQRHSITKHNVPYAWHAYCPFVRFVRRWEIWSWEGVRLSRGNGGNLIERRDLVSTFPRTPLGCASSMYAMSRTVQKFGCSGGSKGATSCLIACSQIP